MQTSAAVLDDRHASNRKKTTTAALLNAKPFPGVGKFQPIAFMSFLLLGPPAGERCWNRLALDAHLEAAPPRPRGVPSTSGGLSQQQQQQQQQQQTPRGVTENEVHAHHFEDYLVRSQQQHVVVAGVNGSDRKRMKKEHAITSMPPVASVTNSSNSGGSSNNPAMGLVDDENEAIRIFNAETAARAQRLEELKLALSLFPDDDNIKAELKQFVDSQRRTILSAESTMTTM
jgi:hypothetical protein